MQSKINFENISRIDKRTIEANAIVPLIKQFSKQFGETKTIEILTKLSEKEAFDRGERTQDLGQYKKLDGIFEEVSNWGDGDSWEIEVLEKSDTTFSFNILRCPYYDKYKQLGFEKYGVQLSCCKDEPFVRGLNPDIIFKRSKTIMEGDDHCDFRYSLDKE